MKLALRHSLPADVSDLHRLTAALIEVRLVTDFAHAGVVIEGVLYHATGVDGVHAEADADLSGYVLIDLGDELDAVALARFAMVNGAAYDYVSLGAFVVAPVRDSQRWYCYELAFFLMTGRNPLVRVTPEVLILTALGMGGRLISAVPQIKSRAVEVSQ